MQVVFLFRLTEALRAAEVDYAVVGGFAVALHGVLRGTIDVDLALRVTEKDFVAAERAFAEIGLVSRLPITAKDVIRFREEYVRNRNLVAWSFYDPAVPINQVDILLTEDLKQIKSETLSISGHPVRVATIEALIQMKTRSGREQDLSDVKSLKEVAEKRARGKKK